MPLFIYKCTQCDNEMEKFQHNGADTLELKCPECGCEVCEKMMPFFNNRVWLDAKDMLKERIEPEAKQIMDKMRKGKDKAFFDIYGEK